MARTEQPIIDSLEANLSKSQVRANTRANVSDYYARQQINMVEAWNGTFASVQYIDTVAENESGISDNRVTMPGDEWQGNLTTTNVTLTNGTTTVVYE
ncbi:hypothetical protein [Halomicrobium salinisoli]|uniref:hypothetical protein n=1 Tax=Halomicrobium salinisoli TaxID=2878391 RepID=UPI001CF00BD5|nr:hypothetical protein [Halomicrobium salinisoli]